MISALTLLAALLSGGFALSILDEKARHHHVSVRLKDNGGFGR